PGGTLIEAAPVIIVPAEQCPLLDRTIRARRSAAGVGRAVESFAPAECAGAAQPGTGHTRSGCDGTDCRRRRGDDRLSLPALVQAAGLKPQVMKVLLSGRRCAPQRAAARPAAGADEPRPVSLRPRAVAGTGNPHCNSGRGNGRSRAPRRIETPNEPRRGSRPIRRGAVRTEKT